MASLNAGESIPRIMRMVAGLHLEIRGEFPILFSRLMWQLLENVEPRRHWINIMLDLKRPRQPLVVADIVMSCGRGWMHEHPYGHGVGFRNERRLHGPSGKSHPFGFVSRNDLAAHFGEGYFNGHVADSACLTCQHVSSRPSGGMDFLFHKSFYRSLYHPHFTLSASPGSPARGPDENSRLQRRVQQQRPVRDFNFDVIR